MVWVYFLGRPHKFVIRGQKAGIIFKDLEPLLQGNHTLSEIFQELKNIHAEDDISFLLKSLHTNCVLEEPSCVTEKKDKQLQITQFYNRVKGHTGFLDSGSQVNSILKKTKVLLVASEDFLPAFINSLFQEEFNGIGIISDASKNDLDGYFSSTQCIDKVSLHNLEQQDILNIISDVSPNYQYVIVALKNASTKFIGNINRLLVLNNIPALYLSYEINQLEIYRMLFLIEPPATLVSN
jgi:hypothetical protein